MRCCGCSIESEWDHFARRVRASTNANIIYATQLALVCYPRMLLKSDLWRSESHDMGVDGVRGAINFRNIPGTNIFALGQPNEEAIDAVVRRVKEDFPSVNKIAWINLR